ncbi:MAG TPA: hypothetical protein GXZ40_07820, partial [Bacteroidales bacterium]|nr:hypothetical protein [Bacteroidales bacterium]
AAKKRACKLFLPPCVPTACARGLGTGRRPVSVSERDTPKRKLQLFLYSSFLHIFVIDKKQRNNIYS